MTIARGRSGSAGRRWARDMRGQRFGRVVVVERVCEAGKTQPRWHCLCDCGNKTISLGSELRRGRVTSCGDCPYEYQGEWRTIREWARRVGLAASLIYRRLGAGWTLARALETPRFRDAFSNGALAEVEIRLRDRRALNPPP